MMIAAEQFGPVELFVVEFEGDRPDAGVLAALRDLGAEGHVRLVDLVVAARRSDGSVSVSELSELDLALDGVIDLVAEGLVGEDDVTELVENVEPGFGIAIAALEMRWAVALSSAVAAAKGRVVQFALISAPTVNELVATTLSEASASGPLTTEDN